MIRLYIRTSIPGVLDLSMYVLIKSGGGGDPTADIIGGVVVVEVERVGRGNAGVERVQVE